MLSEAKHLLFAESGAGRAISIGLVEEARSLPVEEGRGAGRNGVTAALCKTPLVSSYSEIPTAYGWSVSE
jgi:hypothetical protein